MTSAIRTQSRMSTARRAAGFTLPRVADHMRRSQQTVERWERGQQLPSRDCLTELARLYGVPVAELVD